MLQETEKIFYENKKEPHLRIAITPKCNFNCIYCRPGGEGLCENGELMTSDEIIEIIKAASEIGFKYIKFTGGEPLLRRDLIEIIENTRKLKDIKELSMVTNGSLITRKYLEKIKDSRLDNLTISLDSANKKIFNKISRSDCFERVLKGISIARDVGFQITINTVLMKSNFRELNGLINICCKNRARLKLIDYMNLGNNELWEREYLPFKNIRRRLEKESVSTDWTLPYGGIGTPMPTYKLKKNVEVLVRDATVGTYYHKSCKSCKNYPCQDALISLRVTHNGKLKRCLIRDDNLVDILSPLREGKVSKVKDLIKESYEIFAQAKFYPNAWKPKFKQEVK